LLPELAPTGEDKVRLATWQSVGYVFGIGISSCAFNLTDALQTSFHIAQRVEALQLAVAVLAVLAAIFMAITVFSIDEKKYCKANPSHVPIMKALKQTLGNKNFRLFIVADVSFFMSVTIITSGLLFFLTILLRLEESMGSELMITMVLVSFIFYPVVNFLVKKIGKKIIVIFSLAFLAFLFLGVYFLGKIPPITGDQKFDHKLQVYILIILTAIPVASLNILPNAIMAEIIEKDTFETGENKEAIYFAVRYFFVKMAQTLGIALFSIFLLFGKDEGNDFGIRLNGLLGFGLCLMAALIFLRFKDVRSKK
jgi:GPH family glycoside/pentoside/hexuronide:cation symporter